MRVALITCPFSFILIAPYNLALLSACLKEGGNDVFCFDFNIQLQRYNESRVRTDARWPSVASLDWHDKDKVLEFMSQHDHYINLLVDEVLEKDIQVVGFSIYDSSRWFSEEIASRMKQKDPSLKIVFGGYPCFREGFPLRVIENPNVDAVCLGEGEVSLVKLVRQLEEKGQFSFCPGFVYRGQDNSIVNCGKEPLIQDLDATPFSDFSDFDLRLYEMKGIGIATNRGCSNCCLFCEEAMLLQPFRRRSALNIYSELSFQFEKHPSLKYVFFNDSAINGDMRQFEDLADLLIKNKLNFFQWGGQARIKKGMDRAFFRKMKEAGFSFVSYGLESASPKVVKMMGKSFDVGVAENVIRDTHEAGIRSAVNVIVGFPGETQKDISITLRFLQRNLEFIDDIYIHTLVLLPNSVLYRNRDKFGIVISGSHPASGWRSLDGSNDYESRMASARFLKEGLGKKANLSC
ncbi:MAG: cobalamin-dependent protein [Candidatus Omnitrophica bacterium]|nr:cobalamin-dependent protein [Candidatus Omnitrophota bacterium]